MLTGVDSCRDVFFDFAAQIGFSVNVTDKGEDSDDARFRIDADTRGITRMLT